MTKKTAPKAEASVKEAPAKDVKLGNKKVESTMETKVPATVSALARAVSHAGKLASKADEDDVKPVAEPPKAAKSAPMPPARPMPRPVQQAPSEHVTTMEEVLAARQRVQKPRASGRFDPSKYLTK